ncbi:hypothetical protein ACFQ9X_33080 [Catenulispora yoronensis]
MEPDRSAVPGGIRGCRSVHSRARPAADRRIHAAHAAHVRLGETAPTRPTWIGDRFSTTGARIHADFGLDLDHVWPRLWVILPEPLRTDLSAAQDAYATASRRTAWGVMYAFVAVVWWPALAIGAAVIVAGETRSRTAAVALTDLICASVELYVTDLADRLGITATRPLQRSDGLEMMKALIVIR